MDNSSERNITIACHSKPYASKSLNSKDKSSAIDINELFSSAGSTNVEQIKSRLSSRLKNEMRLVVNSKLSERFGPDIFSEKPEVDRNTPQNFHSTIYQSHDNLCYQPDKQQDKINMGGDNIHRHKDGIHGLKDNIHGHKDNIHGDQDNIYEDINGDQGDQDTLCADYDNNHRSEDSINRSQDYIRRYQNNVYRNEDNVHRHQDNLKHEILVHRTDDLHSHGNSLPSKSNTPPETLYRRDSLESLPCSQSDAELLRAVSQDIINAGTKIIQELEDEVHLFFVKTTEDIAKHIAKLETKQNENFGNMLKNLQKFYLGSETDMEFGNIAASTSSTNAYNE